MVNLIDIYITIGYGIMTKVSIDFDSFMVLVDIYITLTIMVYYRYGIMIYIMVCFYRSL